MLDFLKSSSVITGIEIVSRDTYRKRKLAGHSIELENNSGWFVVSFFNRNVDDDLAILHIQKNHQLVLKLR